MKELRNLFQENVKSQNIKKKLNKCLNDIATILLAFGDFIVMIIILIFGFLSCIKVILDGIAEIIGRRLKKNGCFIRK